MERPIVLAVPILIAVLTVCQAHAEADSSGSDLIESMARKSLPELDHQAVDYYRQRAVLRIATHDYAGAIADLNRASANGVSADVDRTIPLRLYAVAKRLEQQSDGPSPAPFERASSSVLSPLSDTEALNADWLLETRPEVFEKPAKDCISKADWTHNPSLVACVDANVTWRVAKALEPHVVSIVAKDDAKRYIIDDSILIKTPDGAQLSALVVRKRALPSPQPASLYFTIYTNDSQNLHEAKQAAVHGYVGVVVDARGKRLSESKIDPWVHEGADAYAAIDWISKQEWSDGQVGMYGGSYTGLVQWAAAKYSHPALKTIVPYAASHPGLGIPMQNNIFQTANYGWYFFVANSRYLDYATYGDQARWESLTKRWFLSGRAFKDLDAIDGTPNPLFREQLRHPSFDSYWQKIGPWGPDFAAIKIPVLSITGYFDDAQVSAIKLFREHRRFNPSGEQFLVIGPYDHFGCQLPTKPSSVKNYSIDPAAQFDTVRLTYDWFDHVMRGRQRPSELSDRVNYEVMGLNQWAHANSIEHMGSETRTYFLSAIAERDTRKLLSEQEPVPGSIVQRIDLADRDTQLNLYPVRVLTDHLDAGAALKFVSEPLDKPVIVSGQITGDLIITQNKRDLDYALALYEVTEDGHFFNLSYSLARASFASDPTTRVLLKPQSEVHLPVANAPITSRYVRKGSRFMLLVSVNKNEYAQINYGTGGDVSSESARDAGDPLTVLWSNRSHVTIPTAPANSLD